MMSVSYIFLNKQICERNAGGQPVVRGGRAQNACTAHSLGSARLLSLCLRRGPLQHLGGQQAMAAAAVVMPDYFEYHEPEKVKATNGLRVDQLKELFDSKTVFLPVKERPPPTRLLLLPSPRLLR